MKKPILLLILLTLCNLSFGQEKESDASWDETVKWIGKKLESGYLLPVHYIYEGQSKGEIAQKKVFISDDEIWATIENTVYQNNKKIIRILILNKADLNKLQGAEINKNKLSLSFYKGGVNGKKTIFKGGKKVESNNLSPSLYLFFDNDDIVIRLQKAFKHLIFLKNGKEKF